MEAATTAQRPRQQPPPQQPESLTEEAAVAALIVVLLSGAPFAVMADAASSLLGRLGIPTDAVRRALALLYVHIWVPGFRVETREPEASSWLRRTRPARQALYLVRASRRLAEGGTEQTERTYLRQHLDAERRRREAVERVDAAARRFGPVLGWHAVLDSRTTGECRKAHARNFRAARPPAIGYPGSLHAGACRCRPGPPFARAAMLDELPG